MISSSFFINNFIVFSILFNCSCFILVLCHTLLDKCEEISKAPGEGVGNTSESTLQWLTDPCRYDRWVRPPKHNNAAATAVFVRIYIYFLGSIEEQHLHFTAHALIRYRWLDERLSRNSTSNLQGEMMMKERLWTPHLYIVNEHDSQIMGSGRKDVLVTVEPDGTVLFSTRLKVTLLCLMNLQKFPFDQQRCPLILESWAYNTTDLMLYWERNSPVVVNSQLHMTEYNLMSVKTNSSSVVYALSDQLSAGSSEHLHYFGKFAGNYSCLTVYFQLQREVGHYIMDYYVPSILLVMVSWVSFWLDPNAVPGRTTLGTSTMLTFITLSRNMGSSLPKVSYIKATEIWFIACTAFIFGSLVEFAFVNTIWRRRKNIELKKVTGKHVLKATLTPQINRRDLSEISSKIRNKHFHKSNSMLTVSPVDIDCVSIDPKATECFYNNNYFAYDNDHKQQISSSNSSSEQTAADGQQQHGRHSFFMMTPQEIAQWIDRRSRIVFPIAFFIFNCIYWIFVYI